jgi:hypothetical protein
MNEHGGQHEEPDDEPIELERLVPRVKRATPVPSSPAHLCPRCDYNLAGLTSRRCPECGSPFTLIAARSHAFDKTEAGQLRRREERREKKKSSARVASSREDLRGLWFLIGFVLIVLGFVSPGIVGVVWPRPVGSNWFFSDVKVLFRVMIVFTTMVPVDTVIAIFAARRGWSWTPTVLFIGILTCVVGTLIGIL